MTGISHEWEMVGMYTLSRLRERVARRAGRGNGVKSAWMALVQHSGDRHSCPSLETNLGGVCIPSPVTMVETPANRAGFQASRRPEGRGFKPELVLR
jgi:hypothetical protein